jgi:hypothetical protein
MKREDMYKLLENDPNRTNYGAIIQLQEADKNLGYVKRLLLEAELELWERKEYEFLAMDYTEVVEKLENYINENIAIFIGKPW